MRKTRILLILLSFVLPVLLLGCEGDTGPQGAQGPEGPQGPPGTVVLANETCVLCHGEDKFVDVAVVHAENLPENQGTATATIDTVTFGAPVGDNVTVTVNFTFQAFNSAGQDITSTIDLRTISNGQLSYARFGIAKLVAGSAAEGFSNHWEGYLMNPLSNGSSRFQERIPGNLTGDPATGVYSYVFNNSVHVSDGYVDNAVHRVAIQLSGFPAGSFNPDTDVTRPVGNITSDMVNPIGGGTVTAPFSVPAGYPSKEVVTTAACNACHNPLAIHGGGRREIKFCQTCHNQKINTPPGPGGLDLVNLVHKIHTAQEVVWPRPDSTTETFDEFTDVTFPQDPRNCTTCHQGGVDSDNWKERPSREACGACHSDVDFASGAGHQGGAQATDAGCTLCHDAVSDGFAPSIPNSMATENITPNNPQLPAALSRFEYFLDNVAVDNTGLTTVGFRITQDGAPLNLSTGAWPPPSNTATPIANTSGPSFLLAWALPQDGIDEPAEYTNRNSPDPPSSSNGNGAGDAPGVSLRDLVQNNLVTPSGAGYTAVLSSSDWTAPGFPPGATMRAVALQSYFTQDTGTDNVGRHTPSVVLAVPGDDVRRQVVKSGYTGDPAAGGQPFGCLECHETLELHGGSRVNNVQVCVFCHNPNKSSSGRTVDPANINPDVVAALGSNPLTYPEASNNFKNMIHGIHAATERPFQFVRNRLNGFYYNWSEVTFPGNLMDCEKCHIGDSYVPSNVPATTLWNVERITTGNPAETRADIIGARGSVPNPTDLVDSPIAGACFYCHDDGLAKSHILTQGGKLSIWPSVDTGTGATSREDASILP